MTSLTVEEIHAASRIIDAADSTTLETFALAVKFRRDTLARQARLTFATGDRVCFVGRYGAIVSGMVVPTHGHTSKTVHVQADKVHGGRIWRVSAGLLRHDTGPWDLEAEYKANGGAAAWLGTDHTGGATGKGHFRLA